MRIASRVLHALEAFEDSVGTFDHLAGPSPLWGTRMSAVVSPQTRPLWQTNRNMPASI